MRAKSIVLVLIAGGAAAFYAYRLQKNARQQSSSSATVTKQRSWLRSNIDTCLKWIRRFLGTSSIDHPRNKDGGC